LTSGDPTAVVEEDGSIGARIRRERHRRDLTLADLAERASITVNTLSMIERGTSEPSLASVRRIAKALGLEAFQLLLPGHRPEIVIRRSERPTERSAYANAEFRRLTGAGVLDFTVSSLEIQPGAAAPSAKAGAHDEQECAVVINGRVRIDVADFPYDLEPGDSITIDRDLPHRYVNTGDVVAELLIVSGRSGR
jgi:transcriptional regulator with XRE-family HTH domain